MRREAPSPPARRRRVVLPDSPNDAVIYAIGDVHGCFDQLVRLEERIVADGRDRPQEKIVVMLGDYVDRGPESAQVLRHLLDDMPPGFRRVCLCGNHEEMMLRFLADPLANVAWVEAGGAATLTSYGFDVRWLLRTYRRRPDQLVRVLRDAVTAEHIEFLRGLPVLAASGRRVFVHAGIRPGVPLDRQTDTDLLWIREPFLTEGPGLPLVVVHGHTPTLKPIFHNNRLCIDTGAYASGRLTAVRCIGAKATLLTADNR